MMRGIGIAIRGSPNRASAAPTDFPPVVISVRVGGGGGGGVQRLLVINFLETPQHF